MSHNFKTYDKNEFFQNSKVIIPAFTSIWLFLSNAPVGLTWSYKIIAPVITLKRV